MRFVERAGQEPINWDEARPCWPTCEHPGCFLPRILYRDYTRRLIERYYVPAKVEEEED